MIDCSGTTNLQITGLRLTSPKTLAAWIGDDMAPAVQKVGWGQQVSPPSAFALRRAGAGNITAWSISTEGVTVAAGAAAAAAGPFVVWGTASSLNILSRNGEHQTIADLAPSVLTDFVVGIQNAPIVSDVFLFDRILTAEERADLFAWMEAKHAIS